MDAIQSLVPAPAGPKPPLIPDSRFAGEPVPLDAHASATAEAAAIARRIPAFFMFDTPVVVNDIVFLEVNGCGRGSRRNPGFEK
jgi:hypothetical protein